jgi:hypothetical protein
MVRDTPELVQLVQQLGIPAVSKFGTKILLKHAELYNHFPITFQNIPPPATNFYTMQDGLANIYV